METTMHRQLKERFGTACGGRSEVALAGFRIDAIDPEGRLVEVQQGSLGPLRAKLGRLLEEHPVRVVKPVVLSRRLVRRKTRDGVDLAVRQSPKRGRSLDVFDDLVGLAQLFPHPNLWIEVLAVEIDEVRIARRRWPGYKVVDRLLRNVVGSTTLRAAGDLWSLIPSNVESPFTTRELAECLGKPLFFAQRVAYCLRLAGAARSVGKRGNSLVYVRPDPPTAIPPRRLRRPGSRGAAGRVSRTGAAAPPGARPADELGSAAAGLPGA
jgi:hypothetical protein